MPTGNAANPRGHDPSWRAIPQDVHQGDLAVPGTSMSTRPASKPTTKSPCRCADSTSSSLTAWWAGPPENTSPVMRYQSAGLDEWRTKTDHETAAMLTEQSVDGVVLAPNGPDCCKNVPALARHLERARIPTVLVTMMPDVAEKLDTPRIVGVEFPFGHAFGPADDRYTQRRVPRNRVPTVLSGASEPGVRLDVDIEWPVEAREAYKAWQPAEPSPIIRAGTGQ